MQFKRDKKVDSEILSVLRSRFEECVAEHHPDQIVYCQPLWDYYKRAEENWFSKCTYFSAFLQCSQETVNVPFC